jgi:hypothetical protein
MTITTFNEGQRVRFREPLAPDTWSDGFVIYTLRSGTVGIRPDGCYVSRVLIDPEDVEAA